jgi:putative ABC transport system substrate-binding protein
VTPCSAGNLTGAVSLNTELESKRSEVLHEAVPTMKGRRPAPQPRQTSAEGITKNTLAAARVLGIELQVVRVNAQREFQSAFATMIQVKAAGLVIGSDPFFYARMDQLSELASSHKLPAISAREFAVAGGLLGYGASNEEAYPETFPVLAG